jgi:hypothetical protein
MISDVLFEAVKEIRRYQRDMPRSYDFMKGELDWLVEEMDRIREMLDTPPEMKEPGGDEGRPKV